MLSYIIMFSEGWASLSDGEGKGLVLLVYVSVGILAVILFWND